jgi:hypothetical protein
VVSSKATQKALEQIAEKCLKEEAGALPWIKMAALAIALYLVNCSPTRQHALVDQSVAVLPRATTTLASSREMHKRGKSKQYYTDAALK